MYKQAIVNNLIKIAAESVVPKGFFNITDVNMKNPFVHTGMPWDHPFARAFEDQRDLIRMEMDVAKQVGVPFNYPKVEGPAGLFNITDVNMNNPFDRIYQAEQYKNFERQREWLKMKAEVAKEFESANAAVEKMRQSTENLNNKFSRIEQNLAGVPSSQPAPTTTTAPTTTAPAPKSNVPSTTGGNAVGGIGRTIDNFLARNKWVAPTALIATPLAIAGGAYLWNRNRRTYGAPTPGVGAFGQMALDRFVK